MTPLEVALAEHPEMRNGWQGGVPKGSICGRVVLAPSSRAYADTVRRRSVRQARRERFFVIAAGGFIGAVMALSGRWLLDRGVRRG